MPRARVCIALLVVALGAFATTARAQRGFGGGRFSQIPIKPNASYDGRFTFVRIRYGPDYGFASQRLPWSHDYPAGEQHFMKIMNEVTLLQPHIEETNILPFDSPDLGRYPVAYLCEPGGWSLSDEEAASLRAYLQKGGFMIVDDFRFQHWSNFEQQMLRVLPEARFADLDISQDAQVVATSPLLAKPDAGNHFYNRHRTAIKDRQLQVIDLDNRVIQA